MGLQKKLENGAEIVLLYAKSFTWKSESERKLLNNEPTAGKVYRALKDTTNNCWYVSVDIDPSVKRAYPVEGVRLTSLSYNTPEWDCDMVELNDDNITTFDISTEDFRKINNWVEQDHADFIERLEKKNGLDIVSSNQDMPENDPNVEPIGDVEEFNAELSRKVLDALSSSIVPYQTEAFKALEYLSMRDPWLLQAISSTLTQVVKQTSQEDSGPILAISREISMCDELGKGGNIYSAVANIEDYINTDKNIGGRQISLDKAIYFLLLEVARLKTKE